MGASTKGPKVVTVYGRLSFPQWTAKAAYDASQGSNFPAPSIDKAKPNFSLVLDEAQLGKLRSHIENVFLPYCIEQEKNGEKRDTLNASEVKKLLAQFDDGFEGDYNTPLKPVNDKTKELAPEAAAIVKCIGNEGQDLQLSAIVNDETELLVPDPDQVKYPVVKPIGQTVHDMYPGAYVAVTLNLYAYHNGKLPGFSAGASVAIFKADADRFGGGVAVDEDEVFSD